MDARGLQPFAGEEQRPEMAAIVRGYMSCRFRPSTPPAGGWWFLAPPGLLGDLEEGFYALKVAFGNLAGGFAGRVVGEARFGVRLLLFE